MTDTDAPQGRPRRNSVDNVHPFPPPLPPHARPTRTLSHPTPRHFPSHSLPPPSQTYPSSGPVPLPTSTLAPADIRTLADSRTIPSPSERPNDGPNPSPVTSGFSQDSISTYRAPQTPSASTASESVDVKPPSGMEYGSHQGSWSMNQDHRNNGSISNGYGQSMSPSHPNDRAYHPPPPPPPGQYGQYIPYAPNPYMGQYSGPGQAQIRRKQVRATQACNHCRSRKQKCDEARPCHFCRENNFDCQYKDVPPPKQDRSIMQLQDSVNNISDVLRDFISEFSAWRQDVEGRLPSSRRFGSTTNIASPDAAFQSKMSSVTAQDGTVALSQQPVTPAESVGTYSNDSSNTAKQNEFGLQSDHTTPAHVLLEKWGLMEAFSSNVEYLQRLKEAGYEYSVYPMRLEQDRGLLRVWGVGEGHDLNDGAQGPGSPESSVESYASSPAPGNEGLRGHPPWDYPSPNPTSSSTPRQYPGDEPVGRPTPDGKTNFSSAVVDQLHKSYLEHMHTLHPFLNPTKLSRMIRGFKDQYSPDARATTASSPAASQWNPSVKRKRTSSASGEPYSPRGSIEHSLRNTIVLLVLALGQVCCYKHPLPSPQSDGGQPTSGAWGSIGLNPNSSFISESSEDNRMRNIDILPGMAYFAYATDMLGNQQGGTTVDHAQANLLASLYIGQFARVLESWSWIHSACRVTAILIKQDYDNLKREADWSALSSEEQYRLELVLLAYWTCVQLESDILAELSILPPSDVTKYQGAIMYPKGVNDRFPTDENERTVSNSKGKELMIYSSQIWMRVILNQAHNALYGAHGIKSFDSSNIKVLAKQARWHMNTLKSWRRVLPENLAWKDEDPPATDLNTARLRAKYYGGLYMVLRPHLRIAVHDIEYPPSHLGSRPHQNPQWSQNNSPIATGDVSNPTSRSDQMMDLSDGHLQIISLASICIESAIKSTIAFDRVGAHDDSPYEGLQSTRKTRLIVTNIFGTLHAQFGNILVLAAVYKSKLYPHLPANTSLTPMNLHALFTRTLKILDEVAPNSPILKLDSAILRNVRAQLMNDGILYQSKE